MSPQDFMGNIKGKVIPALSIFVCTAVLIFGWTWLETRASAQEVARAVESHDTAEDAHGGKIDGLECAVREVQQTTSAIAVAIDRMDRAQGGPGLPADALKMELLE